MILLRLISWQYARKHALRTVLTTVGIVLGVSVFVGMRTANRTVLEAFSRTVDRIAGKAELQVTAGDTGFGEDVLERVQAVSSVNVAVPVIEAVADPQIPGQGNLLVLGIDMTGDRSLREYDLEDAEDAVIDDALVFLAQPDSLMLSREFARKNGIAAGSRLTLGTAEGHRVFTVRGIMKSSGLASAFAGNLAIMDIYAAQRMFGRGRTFDRIELTVKPGLTIAQGQRDLRAALGPAFTIQPPSGRGQQFEAMLAGYSMMVGISSVFAVFIGMFIIYNSFAIAVSQRRTEIGILRALGATRGQIRWLFLGESAVLGLAGSVVGVALGIGAARLISEAVGSLIADVYGVAQRSDALALGPWQLASAVAIGVATSLVAGAIPARAAARVDPVRALQKGSHQMVSRAEHRTRAMVAAALTLVSFVCLTAADVRPIFYLGYILAIVVAIVAVPILSVAISHLLRPVLKRLRPVEGALAADSLIGSPRRTSSSVAALMCSIALIVAFAGMVRASYDSIVTWMDTTLNPDLFVLPSQRLDVQTTRFPAAMQPEIASIPGVARVQMLRNGRITFRDTPVMVVAIEVSSVAEHDRREPVAGSRDDMYRRAAAGEGVMVSDTFAQLQHVRLGETIDVPAPYGTIHLPIVGVVIDYSDQQGTILMDRSLFIRYWHDDSVNAFRVYVAPGADVLAVRQRILERYAGTRQVFAMTNGDVKGYIMKVTDQWFGLNWVQIAIAAFVAVLGIVNTLTVSITDRRRELAVLRAVGAFRGEVRRTVWLEALGIGTVGLILGCAVGSINLYYTLEIVQRDIAGMRLDYIYPVTIVLMLIPTILAAAFIAALWPARSAVRGSLVEALEYE